MEYENPDLFFLALSRYKRHKYEQSL